MLLYDSPVSGNCYKVRLLFAHLGLAYERRELSVVDRSDRDEVIGDLNPALRVPTLVLDDGRALAESNAIIWYFAEGTPYLPEIASSARRSCSGCSSSSTTTSRRSRSCASGSRSRRRRRRRPRSRRAAPPATARSTRWSAGSRTRRSSSATATRSPTSPSTPTPTSRREGGFDLARLPGDRRLARTRRRASRATSRSTREPTPRHAARSAQASPP